MQTIARMGVDEKVAIPFAEYGFGGSVSKAAQDASPNGLLNEPIAISTTSGKWYLRFIDLKRFGAYETTMTICGSGTFDLNDEENIDVIIQLELTTLTREGTITFTSC